MDYKSTLWFLISLSIIQVKSQLSLVNTIVKPSYLDGDEGRCVIINQKICQDSVYNSTMMPTWLGIASQEEARRHIENYTPLLSAECSNYLRMFLCSVYFPMCVGEYEKPIGVKPCKSLCIHVQVRCESALQKYKLNWPKDLFCEKLPDSPELCLQPQDYKLDNQDINKHNLINYPIVRTNENCIKSEISVLKDTNLTCASFCEADLLYRKLDKRFAETWILAWSIICLFSSFLTIIIFSTDKQRFQYPERPVVYLGMCYFALATAFLLRTFIGYERAACNISDNSQSLDQVSSPTKFTPKFLIKPGFENSWCTIIALIINYFTIASNLWWVMLGISWFLSASLKWSHEGVDSVSSAFHLISWSLPAIQAILALILHRIDADELTGICSVGLTDRKSLLYFVIIPQFSCLFIGFFFMLIGFMGVFRIRKDIKLMASRSINNSNINGRKRLERLIAKLGVYTVLYCLPSTFLVCHYIYDYLKIDTWFLMINEVATKNPDCFNQTGIVLSRPICHPRESPSPEAGLLRIFTCLVIGITSGMWIWANGKTMRSLKRIICCQKTRLNKIEQIPNQIELMIQTKSSNLGVQMLNQKQTAPHSSSNSLGEASSIPNTTNSNAPFNCTKSSSSGGFVIGGFHPGYTGYKIDNVTNGYLHYGAGQKSISHPYNLPKVEDEFSAQNTLITDMSVSNKYPCV